MTNKLTKSSWNASKYLSKSLQCRVRHEKEITITQNNNNNNIWYLLWFEV